MVGRKRERETSMCGCLSCVPHQEPGPQPRHVAWLGIKPATWRFPGRCSIHGQKTKTINMMRGTLWQSPHLPFSASLHHHLQLPLQLQWTSLTFSYVPWCFWWHSTDVFFSAWFTLFSLCLIPPSHPWCFHLLYVSIYLTVTQRRYHQVL